MALWAKAQQLPPDSLGQIRAIYNDHFPIEVRHYLANYIEDKFWVNVEPLPDIPQHEHYVAETITGFINEIENKAAAVTNEEFFLVKLKLAEVAKYFRHKYIANPMALYNYIRQCLTTEYRVIQAITGDVSSTIPNITSNNRGAEILRQIETLRRRTQETSDDIRRMEQEQEAFALQYHECTKMNGVLQKLSAAIQQLTAQANNNLQAANSQGTSQQVQKLTRQREMMEQLLNQKVAALMQLRITVQDKLRETHQMLTILQSLILDEELIQWKREQQLAGNGQSFNNNLDTIQDWCESLAELIWLTRQHCKDVDRLKTKLPLDGGIQDVLPQLTQEVTQLLSSLVTSTFIIEKQPPQVMKTNTRFTATVRLLVGGKLNVHMTPPQVRVSIISEAQANVLLKNDKSLSKNEGSGEILNNTGTMEYQQATKQLSVSFRNMQLKKIKRAEKKGTESVMDEKFSLLFQSGFSVGGGELVFNVWTLSLPVVVIVHGNQEPHAWATVTWDNAFAEQGRIPFTIPDKAPWNKVAETLSMKFKASTGRLLTDDNLQFLAEKAFRDNYTDGNQMLTWAQFCKEPLHERNFTFWEWFYAVMKLTKEHLRSQWTDGAILGFVRKRQAEEMLTQHSAGTFLLRFSDSELGGVTIAWVSENQEVFMLQPFTSKDFQIRSLADRIGDLQHLAFLYPDIPKDRVFNKYYTPFTDTVAPPNGYVRPLLRVSLPGFEGGIISYPNTPQHHPFMQSPDPSRDTPSVQSTKKDPMIESMWDEDTDTLISPSWDDQILYSVATATTAPVSSGMEYLDQLEDVSIEGLVNFSELMQPNYRQ